MSDYNNSLSTLVDAALSIEKRRVALQVRSSHLALQGRTCEDTLEVLEKVQELENFIDKKVATLVKEHPAYPWFSKVKGVGKENIAKIVGFVDIERATYVSSLWKYCGMHVVDGKAPKPIPGQKLEYNSRLRTMCWRLGNSLLRAGLRSVCVQCGTRAPSGATTCPNCKKKRLFRTVGTSKFSTYYLEEKEKYTIKYRNQGYQVVPATKLPKVEGKKTEGVYKGKLYISEGHIHQMALRKTIKMFLAMLWSAWRESLGLDTPQPYSVTHLGHVHTRYPEEFTDK